MKKIALPFALFLYSLCSVAITEQDGINFVKKYYNLINQYATAENVTIAKKITSMHIDKGFVYPDIELNLSSGMTETKGVPIESVYLSSISSRQYLLLEFIPSKISMLKNHSRICTMSYILDVYSDNELPGKSVWKYSVPLTMEIIDGKIKCIQKKIVPSAKIKYITIEQNIELEEGNGIAIHVDFDIQNMNNKKGRIVAYFYDQNNNTITDLNNTRYGTASPNSQVATWKDFSPSNNNTVYRDFKLTIPYNELHQSGTTSRILKFKIFIWNISDSPSEKIYQDISYNTFTYPPTSEFQKIKQKNHATIQKIDVYNILSPHLKSVRINLKCAVNASKGEPIKICAFFYKSNGTKCYTKIQNYKSYDGQTSIQKVEHCEYDGDNMLNTQLTIPSNILPSGDIGIDIIVQDSSGETLAKSPRRQFTVR